MRQADRADETYQAYLGLTARIGLAYQAYHPNGAGLLGQAGLSGLSGLSD